MTNEANSKLPDGCPVSSMCKPVPEAGVASPLSRQEDWRWWIKKLLVCNPFFLCSAALLLFAINRLSNDPNFLADETQNLLFNFSALQIYEVLLVVTAIVLARRLVWYDSALLVVMENGLVLVPFMLLSQAAFIGDDVARALSLGGAAIAVFRFLILRRSFYKFNLPDRALILGGIVLLVNIVVPRIFHASIQSAGLDSWEKPNLIAWYCVIPLLAVGANLLPRPISYTGNNAERPWLPLFIYALWTIGSGVHAWSLSYICNFHFRFEWVAPALLILAWTFYSRLTDFTANPSLAWKNSLLLFAFVTPLLASGNWRLFFVLCAVNFGIYCILWFFRPRQVTGIAGELALGSIPMLLAGLPQDWGSEWLFGWLPTTGRIELAIGALLVYCILYSLRCRSIKAAVLGVMSIFCLAAFLRSHEIGTPVEIALAFLLLHSMRWEEKGSVGIGRYIIAGLWVAHNLLWTWGGSLKPALLVAGFASLILVVWFFRRVLFKIPSPLLYPLAATLSLLCPPFHWFKNQNSDGMMALVGSFLLFGVGFIVAWTKHYWHGKEQAEDRPSAIQ
jgi:hypothetical protein